MAPSSGQPVDAVTATVAVLVAAGIQLVADTTASRSGFRVWAGGLPESESSQDVARPNIVVAFAGAPGMGAGASDLRPLTAARVDVRSYGRDEWQSARVMVAAHMALKAWARGEVADPDLGTLLVYPFTEAVGAQAFRDPTTQFPLTVRTYTMMHADLSL